MPYATGTSSSQEDLMSQFMTFCVANGWTQDEFDAVNDRMALHRGSVYVQFHWDNTNDIAWWQSLGFTPGNLPGQHPGDCGNVAQSTGAITQGRYSEMRSNGPFGVHHFFAPSAAPYYAYAAVEVSSGVWRFFGMGTLDKVCDWTGGEFAFAMAWYNAYTVPWVTSIATGFDATNGDSYESRANAALHMEGLPGMNANSKWGLFTKGSVPGNDTAGNPRYCVKGGMRGGFFGNLFCQFRTGNMQNMLPLTPIPAIYWRRDTSPTLMYILGWKPDFKQLNIANFEPGQEVTVGSDVWIIFPMNSKISSGLGIDQSGNTGLAIKKIV